MVWNSLEPAACVYYALANYTTQATSIYTRYIYLIQHMNIPHNCSVFGIY